MTRRFLDEIRAEINAQIVTNAAGDITAALLNPLMIDTIDSCIQDECAIASNTTSLAVPTTATWASLGTGVYDIVTGGDGDFLSPDEVIGDISSSDTAGFTYLVEGKVSIEGINQNTSIEFSILADGVPVGFIASVTGGHGERPLSTSFSHLSLSTPAGTHYTIGVNTPNGAETIDIGSVGLSLTIQPTNNP